LTIERDLRKMFENVQKEYDMKCRECEILKQENFLLKKSVREALHFMPIELPETIDLTVPEEEKQAWAERSERFGVVRAKVLEVVLWLNKKEGRAVSYDEVIHAFKSRYSNLYSNLRNPADTISRRVRECRDEGYLVSPSEGYFLVGHKIVDRKVQSGT